MTHASKDECNTEHHKLKEECQHALLCLLCLLCFALLCLLALLALLALSK
jgi:hypothetical protein